MSITQAMPVPERVVTWPRITATVDADGTGTLIINGIAHRCASDSIESLRTGMVARCVTIAAALRRPVRLTVTEAGQSWPLAVRPEGIVQLVSDAGTIPPAAGLAVDEGRCRTCGRLQPVTAAACAQCGTRGPHRVEVDPLDVHDVVPEASDVEELELTHARTPASATRTRPAVRITFSSQPAVVVTADVALGRNPEAVAGRQAVRVASPGRMLSRTHALVDVDETGRIIVTDHHSGNGIEAQTEPPTLLTPDAPYVVAPGTTLLMGDVAVTINHA